MKNKKNQGFTLFETMIGVAIGTTFLSGLFVLQANETEKKITQSFVDQAYDVIRAVDHRIAVDGYDPTLWTKHSWSNESEVVNDLIAKQLTSKHLSTCSGGDWDPVSNSEHNTKLIGCKHWSNRKNNGEQISAELLNDGSGFIQNFNLYIQYQTPEEFEAKFLDIKKSMLDANVKINQELTGSHYIELISMASKIEITSSVCVRNFSDCAIRFSIDRNGGNEYLRADGSNSLIGEHLTFIETKGQAPMKCIRWKNTARDGSGIWQQEIDEECGIGIYKNGTNPVMVDTVSDTGTFKNIVLDQECHNYEWDNTLSKVIDNGTVSPCGTTNKGSEIYQVVENISSKIANIQHLKTDQINVNSLISNAISTKTLNVQNALKTDLIEAYTNNGTIEFDDNANFKEIVSMESNLYLTGDLIGSSNVQVQGNIISDNDVIAKRNIISEQELLLNKVNSEGGSCSKNGSISRTSTGALLSCVSGTWLSAIKEASPVGTITLWASSRVPTGWLELNGQSTSAYPELRAIVGSRVPDMRGTFARGWDHGRGLDSGRGLNTYQSDADQRFTAKWNADDRSGRWPTGIARSNWNPSSGGADGGDGSTVDVTLDNARQIRTAAESRPKNVALMYIIKAK